MYAIIVDGGHQYKVAEGEELDAIGFPADVPQRADLQPVQLQSRHWRTPVVRPALPHLG